MTAASKAERSGVAGCGNAPDVSARLVRELHDGTAAKDMQAWAREASLTLQRLTAAAMHVGDSSFEGWFESYSTAGKGDKQRARDAYAAGMSDPLVMARPAEPEQMTDEWLEGAFKRALFLGNCAPEDPAANVLRGFANRVLQQFGDREGMRDALNIAYTRSKAGATVREQPRHDNGEPAPEDDIAKAKRIMAAVDTYHDRPDSSNRTSLRGAILDELAAAAATVAPTLPRLTKAEIDAIVYRCRQDGDDSTYAVAAAIEAAHGVEMEASHLEPPRTTRQQGERA